ncbi:MAG: hypothetical protein JW860_13800 [Sedimentisphaerales bacterium]|nr:hypothetical protein [Sedimentisphaerales bacterium]
MENTTTGVAGRLRHEDWPMTLSWSKNKLEQDSDVADNEDRFERDSERIYYTLFHDFTDKSHLIFRYEHNNIYQASNISSNTIDSNRLKRKSGKLTFDYYRNNPWGRLVSLYSINYITEINSGQTGTRSINREEHTFDDPFPVTLEKSHIDITTILVTDITGLQVYTESDDYSVVPVDDRVELHLTTLGTEFPNIIDGQRVFVSYEYQADGSREEDSLHQNFRVEQEFDNGLSIYYDYQRLNEEVDSDLDITEASNDYDRNTVGTVYNKGDLFLTADYSRTDSARAPVESTRLGGGYTWKIDPKTTLSTKLSQSWIETGGLNARDTTLFNARGKLKTRMGNHLRLIGGIEWRDEDRSDVGRTQGFRFNSELKYDYRQLSLKMGWEYSLLDRDNIRNITDTKTTNNNFYINVIRQF